MPDTASSIEGIVTRTYRSGLKVDGTWYPFAENLERPEIRPGDAVKLSVDGGNTVTAIEITERGSGAPPEEKISTRQKEMIENLLDEKELNAEWLGGFVRPLTGQTLEDLSKVRARALITFVTGRELPRSRRFRGGGRRS